MNSDYRGESRLSRLVLFLQIYLLVGALLGLAIYLPSSLNDPRVQALAVSLGSLGLWRYGWWLTHLIRAWIYGIWVYPGLRRQSDALWTRGWRPERLHFMMTTYRENPTTTRRVLASIAQQVKEVGRPANLYVGTGHPDDEDVIRSFIRDLPADIRINVSIVRQVYPGKRMAIGLVLRAISRDRIRGDDPIVFMDGDTILEDGCLRKCIPVFAIKPGVDALTTNEKAIVVGPRWTQSWLDMRFAQRHLAMQSHALSEKVLTLTGRMSVFRARAILDEEFISTIENDFLDHWLWGRFRFLSGDDKSTWYTLIKRGSNMLYIPDAMTVTIEYIEGNGIERMKANLLRWSGNMLRNGSRVLALGPRRMGLFIWWCVLDQKIATWTTLIGPITAVAGTLLVSKWFFALYLLWVFSVRLMASIVLFVYGKKIDPAYPFLLYMNQLLNASLKVYMWFRLHKQRWSNRGNQQSAMKGGKLGAMSNGMAGYLTYMSVAMLITGTLFYVGILQFF